DRSIDLLVSRLRQRLGDDAREPEYIKTVRSEGYVFSLPVRLVQIPQAAVFGELQQLQGELSDQRQQDILGMSLAGLVVAALGLL
ncbi:winged helix-turn-helix domain-containing protein, partial [Pseudomonas aeruginosa]|uniref:winged helix-turn-helix domain-containing protein n=1 Tax=Pseudomonas aeruginosa TaxID=287 RepID=UPI0022372F60